MGIVTVIQELYEYGLDSRFISETLDISIPDLLYLQRHPDEIPLGDQLIIRNLLQRANELHAQGVTNIPGEFYDGS